MIWALTTAAGFGFLAGLAVGGVLARRRFRRLDPLPPWPPPLGAQIRSALQDQAHGIIWEPTRPLTWGSNRKRKP